MKTPPASSCARASGLRLWFAAFLCLLVSVASAQDTSTGTITGRVLNQGTGDYLRNAVVTVAGSGLQTLAGEGGTFRLTGVPAGEVRLAVAYTGLDPAEVTVTVTPGGTVTRDIALTNAGYGDVVALGEFVVATGREGNAKAIMEQRFSPNPKKVIAADAMGNVSEGNVGEFLKLMPGVTMDYVEADTRSMRVRGLNPKYANVLLDGMQPASAGSSNIGTGRAFEFEQLSIASIESVELSKAPTPDQPSSVAGTVNLKTKGAFDRQGRRISWSAALATNSYYADLGKTEGWDDRERRKLLPNLSGEFSDVFLDGRLGVLAGFSQNHTIAAQKHIWLWTNNFDADLTNNATEVPVINWIWYQDGPKPTERGNYNVRLDYKFSEDVRVYGRIDLNTYDARFYNRTLSLRPAAYAPGATKTDQTITSGRISTDSNQFMTKEGDTVVLTGGGEYRLGDLTIDVGLHYSRAKNWYGNLEYGHFTDFSSSLRDISWRMTRPSAGSTNLNFTQLTGPDWRNLANYTFDANSIGWHERQSKDQQWTARIDFRHDFSRLAVPQTLKYGALTNLKVLDVRRYGFLSTNPTGPDRVMGTSDDLRPADFVDPLYRSNWDFGGNLDDWAALSPWRLREHNRLNPNDWVENQAANNTNRLQNNWDFKERIHAAYLQDIFKLGSLELAPGVRYEKTESDGKGINRVNNRPITGGSDYDAFLKYLHASYRFTPNLTLRASYHDAITRADIANLIPGISSVDDTNRRISASNPDLKEERSKSFNGSLEYYFEPVGLVSVGVFRTEVRDRQFSNQLVLGPDGYEGDTTYAGWTLLGPVNIAAPTTFKGFEIDYSQQLSFLPGELKGLGVFANYTRVSYDDWGFYTGSPEVMANGGLSFSNRRFSARLNLNWVGKILNNPARTYNVNTGVWTSAAPFVEVYQRDRLAADLNLEYNLTSRLTLFVDGRNIFNEPSQYTYRGVEENFERILKTGAIWMVGIKGRF